MRSHTSTTRRMAFAICMAVAATTLVASTASAQDNCKPDVRTKLQGYVKSTDAQVAEGKALYDVNCTACHGVKGMGDGPAGKAINARNFTGPKEAWVRGSSVLAIYKTLTLGLNANMPAFETLADEKRIAIAHYVRSLMPSDKLDGITDEQLEEACIEISNPKLPAIPVDLAMTVLAEEAETQRKAGRGDRGPAKLNDAANADNGAVVYGMECASCHGDKGQGITNLGRHGRFPFVHTSTYALQNNLAAGTWSEFAEGTVMAMHRTLPGYVGAGALAEQDWKDLHAFVARGLPGNVQVTSDAPPAAAPTAALLSIGEGYELVFKDGKVFKLVTNTQDATAPMAAVTSFEDFKALYKKPYEDAPNLPESLAAGAEFQVQGVVNLDCIGNSARTAEKAPGCATLPEGTPETALIKIVFAAQGAAPTP